MSPMKSLHKFCIRGRIDQFDGCGVIAMEQQSSASHGWFEKHGWESRREVLLDKMEWVVPWPGFKNFGPSAVREVCQRPSARRFFDHTTNFLRIAVIQSVGSGRRKLLYESAPVRRFVGVDLGIAPAPDETMVLLFRHLL